MRITRPIHLSILGYTVLLGLVITSTMAASEQQPLVGQVEQSYLLDKDNQHIRGLAFDDTSTDAARLFVLDRSGTVFVYSLAQEARGQGRGEDENMLGLLSTHDLKADPAKLPLVDPRGLFYLVEDGEPVLFLLDWGNMNGALASRLYCYSMATGVSVSFDLSRHMYCIGDREVFDLTMDRQGQIFVAFDSSGYAVPDRRVQRGVVCYKWNRNEKDLTFVKHMPDAGTEASRGVASMEMDGFHYLWATIGNEKIYCAHGPTGRGLFFFDQSRSCESDSKCGGLCYGAGSLWSAENVPGPDRVHRINVTRNLDSHYEGPRVLRHLKMSIQSEPEGDAENAGTVYHYYSRPYAYEQLQNQGVWPETESCVDLSNAPNARLKSFPYDPAGDKASRQTMWVAEYANGPARTYSSQYEIDLWTNPYKKFVYPHRVDLDRDDLEGTDYLAEDPELYNLNDEKTYSTFIQRVKAHVKEKYNVEADMANPYWAARNIVEYIQDNYYYPNRAKRKPAAVDYDRKHYDANPGNLKIELSGHPYDKNQIIACSGTSVMVAGAMRYLGFPARWLGTGTQQGPSAWDKNRNGLLDRNETAASSNGHRYSQVWLGSHYGWICFDATPSKPACNDYDPPPPLQSQWRYMTRAASGHRYDNRVIYNVGSALFRPLYRDFEYDPALAVDNNCGGDQRYNLQGRFEKPDLWKLPRHRIYLTNLCYVTNVTVTGPKNAMQIAWELDGAWERCSDVTLSIYLQTVDDSGAGRDIAKLVGGLAYDAKSATVDLSEHRGRRLRIILRKDGDPETGGQSELFDAQ